MYGSSSPKACRFGNVLVTAAKGLCALHSLGSKAYEVLVDMKWLGFKVCSVVAQRERLQLLCLGRHPSGQALGRKAHQDVALNNLGQRLHVAEVHAPLI